MKNENFLKEDYKISSAQLQKLIEIAYNIRRAFYEKKLVAEKDISEAKQFLAMILEHLIKNRNNPIVNPTLIEFIEEILGFRKKKDKGKEKTYHEKEQERVQKEFSKHRYRVVMYEIYKIVNPNQLAGETRMDNFLNNLMTRGITVAKMYQGGELAKLFSQKEIENLASYKNLIKHIIHECQNKGIERRL